MSIFYCKVWMNHFRLLRLVPVHSVTWAVWVADQSSVVGQAPRLPQGPLNRPQTPEPLDTSVISTEQQLTQVPGQPINPEPFLLGHCLCSSGSSLLFNLFRLSVELEMRCDRLWRYHGNGTAHAQNLLG